jgi:hypothetical protein
MTPVEHNPNCAIVRSGNIRAWCDCGAEIPVMNEIRARIAEQEGARKERRRIIKWLRSVGSHPEAIILEQIGLEDETDD